LARTEALDSIRLDKWLWCSRFYKTRALAASAIKGNKIRVNDLPVKAAKIIRVGDSIQIRKTPYQYTITILKLANNRLSANLAAHLYKEDKDSVQAREELAKQIKADTASYPRTIGRPTKRNRREIIRFTRINPNNDNGD
jgi:ribosome-associated heat shock protein Hsp15